MAKVAVTGSTGFIGRALVKALLNRGDTVLPVGREYQSVECDVVYHLACPSDTITIKEDTISVMEAILDGTRKALSICPTALFVNASSIGAEYRNNSDYDPQQAYNIAKYCMELYLIHCKPNRPILNYRLPIVYGPGMSNDKYIKRCIDGTAYEPTVNSVVAIAHINDVVNALINYTEINVEKISIKDIYKQFTTGRTLQKV